MGSNKVQFIFDEVIKHVFFHSAERWAGINVFGMWFALDFKAPQHPDTQVRAQKRTHTFMHSVFLAARADPHPFPHSGSCSD